MIHLFSPAPALDLEVDVTSPTTGKIGTLSQASFTPGGKAVNVARFLGKMGVPYRLFLGVGGGTDATHAMYSTLLQNEGLAAGYVETQAPIRLNLVTRAVTGAAKYNHPGFRLSLKSIQRYERQVLARLGPKDLWVLAGRIPAGLDGRRLKSWVRHLESRGCRCALDTSGDALAAMLTSSPSFLKVNLHEISEATGHRWKSLEQIWESLPKLQALGLWHGAITNGAEGAVVWNGAEVSWVRPSHIQKPTSIVVGAGDAFLSGYLKGWLAKGSLTQTATSAAAAGSVVASYGIRGFDMKKYRAALRKVTIE